MQKPFGGFLKSVVVNQAMNMGETGLADAFMKFGSVSEDERKMSKKVEEFMRKKGYKSVSWARGTYVMTILFTIVTILVHFYKADFVNLTVCTIAIHLLTNAQDAQPRHFRYLVAATILTFVYDVAWLLLRGYDMAGNDEEEGGMEASIRKFSLVMTIISLIFKVVMTFVYWMASMRFEDIIDERTTLLKG